MSVEVTIKNGNLVLVQDGFKIDVRLSKSRTNELATMFKVVPFYKRYLCRHLAESPERSLSDFLIELEKESKPRTREVHASHIISNAFSACHRDSLAYGGYFENSANRDTWLKDLVKELIKRFASTPSAKDGVRSLRKAVFAAKNLDVRTAKESVHAAMIIWGVPQDVE